LSISGKRLSSVAKLTAASTESVEEGWAKVQRGLSRVVPMLQEKLLVPTSSIVPSLAALHPLIVYYGRQPEGRKTPMSVEKGLLYWFLAATARNRYGGATDTALTQDIKVLDSENPVKDLLSNLGIVENGISVAASDLAGRSHQSPYLMFSYLAAAHAGATDWWDGDPISASVDGSGKPQYSLAHPAVTLRGHRGRFSSAEINELANIVFVSQDTAKNMIGSRSPAAYVQSVASTDLAAHSIPNDPALLETDSYRSFLAARRELLARRITAILDRFKPDFLGDDEAPAAYQQKRSLEFRGYAGDSRSVLVADAELGGHRWIGRINRAELEAALSAASAGLASDVAVGGEVAAMRADDEGIVGLTVGPFLVRGSVDQWQFSIKEAFDEAPSLTECPEPTGGQWSADPEEFLLSNVGARI
jgi:hypothetical protein